MDQSLRITEPNRLDSQLKPVPTRISRNLWCKLLEEVGLSPPLTTHGIRFSLQRTTGRVTISCMIELCKIRTRGNRSNAKFMLDTSIVLYVIKRRPVEFLDIFTRNVEHMGISSITLAELMPGVEKSSFPEKNLKVVEDCISHLEVLSYDEDTEVPGRKSKKS